MNLSRKQWNSIWPRDILTLARLKRKSIHHKIVKFDIYLLTFQ